MQLLRSALLAAAVLVAAPARADRPQIVAITVTDAAGAPVPNAWVRIPDTEGRRAVDPLTGIWEASMLYHFDGSPFVFERGLTLTLTVSAPGFRAQTLEFEVRARRNEIPVTLERLPENTLEPTTLSEDDEALLEWFRANPEG